MKDRIEAITQSIHDLSKGSDENFRQGVSGIIGALLREKYDAQIAGALGNIGIAINIVVYTLGVLIQKQGLLSKEEWEAVFEQAQGKGKR